MKWTDQEGGRSDGGLQGNLEIKGNVGVLCT